MPHTGTPWVKEGTLITASGETIFVDSPAWFAWLTTATHFCYSARHSTYRLTVRQEKRRHGFYWYGYLKIQGKLHNAYLGKSDRLTQAHLEQTCARLVRKAGAEP